MPPGAESGLVDAQYGLGPGKALARREIVLRLTVKAWVISRLGVRHGVPDRPDL